MNAKKPNKGPFDITDFGYQTVAKDEKIGMVRDLFDGVSNKYDLMNDIMSAGVHRRWKHQMIDRLNPSPGMTLLDMAGGTGDISSRFLKRIGKKASGKAIICDLSEGMVRTGRERLWDSGILSGIDWIVGDAENIPLNNSSVDAYTIAFGIRNVTNKEKALEEAARVIKPGGRFLCLEFSPTTTPLIEQLYRLYSFVVIPTIGAIVAKDRDAYSYLVESIRKFPPPEIFGNMITESGFGGVKWQSLSGGIAAIHSGWRL